MCIKPCGWPSSKWVHVKWRLPRQQGYMALQLLSMSVEQMCRSHLLAMQGGVSLDRCCTTIEVISISRGLEPCVVTTTVYAACGMAGTGSRLPV